MKNTRARLIELAQTDPADEGTEWRDRMEAWLNATRPDTTNLTADTLVAMQREMNRAYDAVFPKRFTT